MYPLDPVLMPTKTENPHEGGVTHVHTATGADMMMTTTPTLTRTHPQEALEDAVAVGAPEGEDTAGKCLIQMIMRIRRCDGR